MFVMDRDISVIAHDIRSAHNVGALLRLCDGMGVNHLYFTGYTPFPKALNDKRLPHESLKLDKQIHKTALGAEKSVNWSHEDDITKLIDELKNNGTELIGIEQAKDSVQLSNYAPPQRICLLLGREVEGIEAHLLAKCNSSIEIPMLGIKESHNVVQAAAMALYHCRFAL